MSSNLQRRHWQHLTATPLLVSMKTVNLVWEKSNATPRHCNCIVAAVINSVNSFKERKKTFSFILELVTFNKKGTFSRGICSNIEWVSDFGCVWSNFNTVYEIWYNELFPFTLILYSWISIHFIHLNIAKLLKTSALHKLFILFLFFLVEWGGQVSHESILQMANHISSHVSSSSLIPYLEVCVSVFLSVLLFFLNFALAKIIIVPSRH